MFYVFADYKNRLLREEADFLVFNCMYLDIFVLYRESKGHNSTLKGTIMTYSSFQLSGLQIE